MRKIAKTPVNQKIRCCVVVLFVWKYGSGDVLMYKRCIKLMHKHPLSTGFAYVLVHVFMIQVGLFPTSAIVLVKIVR